MRKNDALTKIQASLNSSEPQIITPRGESYEEYVRQLSEQLLHSIIEPISVKVTSTIIQDADFDKYRSATVWGIGKSGVNWLLTIEGEQEFALAFGSDPLELKMHGCSSSDALGEWCSQAYNKPMQAGTFNRWLSSASLHIIANYKSPCLGRYRTNTLTGFCPKMS